MSMALQRTMMETNPYLLALTVVVTIVHSVFEFLAFKNGMFHALSVVIVCCGCVVGECDYLFHIADIQFWRTRESLAGLSVRSVFFNVFQSLIVLLYILDSETNAVIIISCFIGLLIDVWKITKVCKVSLNTENRFLGVLPRITLSDQPSYVESSTKEYDRVSTHPHRTPYSVCHTCCYKHILYDFHLPVCKCKAVVQVALGSLCRVLLRC